MAMFIGDDDVSFAERMLENGYLPEGLPPVFRIKNLHEAAIKPLQEGSYIGKLPTDACRYNASKRGGQRRNFDLPNPLFMVDAAIFFLKFKSEIEEHLTLSDNSCSYPRFDKESRRPINISTASEFHRRRRSEFSRSRYIVKTDISRYFHSIYTHAIPWALHGKSASKKDRKVESDAIYGNRLDWLVRQGQDGQTVGIPVGPDFSRIISEIVGVAIDQKFRSEIKPDVPMLRHVDDIYIGSDNLDEANAHLSAIRKAIRTFELDINESKTTIIRSIDDLEPLWPVTIRRELELYAGGSAITGKRKSDFIYFLDDVLRQANINNDDGIVKFAIRKIDELYIWNDYWDILEPFLIRAVIGYPHCWDYVARVVSWRNTLKSVNLPLWCEAINTAIAQNTHSGHDSETTWALWLSRELDVKIDKNCLETIFERCGPFSCLLALDICTKEGSEYKLNKKTLIDRLSEKPMLGEDWLLAFEADRQFGLNIKTKNVSCGSFFKQMYDDDVSFYDKSATLFVFDNIDDLDDAKKAIESTGTSYEDDEIEDSDVDSTKFDFG